MQTNGTKELIFSAAIYSGISILGPLIFFGLIGWWLDSKIGSGHFSLLIGIFVAFIITNFLIIQRAIFLTKKFNRLAGEKVPEQKNINNYDDEADLWPNEIKDKDNII